MGTKPLATQAVESQRERGRRGSAGDPRGRRDVRSCFKMTVRWPSARSEGDGCELSSDGGTRCGSDAMLEGTPPNVCNATGWIRDGCCCCDCCSGNASPSHHGGPRRSGGLGRCPEPDCGPASTSGSDNALRTEVGKEFAESLWCSCISRRRKTGRQPSPPGGSGDGAGAPHARTRCRSGA